MMAGFIAARGHDAGGGSRLGRQRMGMRAGAGWARAGVSSRVEHMVVFIYPSSKPCRRRSKPDFGKISSPAMLSCPQATSFVWEVKDFGFRVRRYGR
jgi:hypothetical protein